MHYLNVIIIALTLYTTVSLEYAYSSQDEYVTHPVLDLILLLPVFVLLITLAAIADVGTFVFRYKDRDNHFVSVRYIYTLYTYTLSNARA